MEGYMTQDEEMWLRELAAEQCVIPQVTARLGPMSLWSKDGLEAEIRRAIEAEREACAKLCDYVYDNIVTDQHIKDMAFKIRARGQAC
jgi:hypothetical protein